MAARKPLDKKEFERLVVRHRVDTPSGRKGVYYLCDCRCGNTKIVSYSNLTCGHTRSCGCISRELSSKRAEQNLTGRTTHGMKGTKEYNAYYHMKSRCYNKNNEQYPYYGGRGITVCDRWKDSFENFYADMGPSPSKKHTVDRKNSNGNYEPANCRWATRLVQSRNRGSFNRIIEFRGESMCLSAWAERVGLSSGCIRLRLESGWSVERALTTPARPLSRRVAKKNCPSSLTELPSPEMCEPSDAQL